jgi:uncharacterized membrane protein
VTLMAIDDRRLSARKWHQIHAFSRRIFQIENNSILNILSTFIVSILKICQIQEIIKNHHVNFKRETSKQSWKLFFWLIASFSKLTIKA